ncbi:hypothetical protein D3OALGA1CA_3120 [Olavius algarvensis associated proteobacterium Delta 3]|nr:hypothetical protein D3OALGA1CA_3120 [Olavius algarvensis associated proteobacterium Delta 3]
MSNRINILCLTMTLLFCWAAPPAHQPAALEVEVIQIRYRWVEDILPVVRNLLSPQGKVTPDYRTNSLVVVDSPEAIQNIRAVLQRLDQAPAQVRIEVRFGEITEEMERAGNVTGKISGEGWEISKGDAPKDGVQISLDEQRRKIDRSSGYTLLVQSGTPGYLRVGKDIPYRENWNDLCQKYGGCGGDGIRYKRVETGMDVNPRIVGEKVILEITPRISDVSSKGVIRFAGASTQITLPLGEWVTIGGSDETANAALQAILARGSGNRETTRSISLRVTRYP